MAGVITFGGDWLLKTLLKVCWKVLSSHRNSMLKIDRPTDFKHGKSVVSQTLNTTQT
jgi:hypothetical protein